MTGVSFQIETKGFEKVNEVFTRIGNPDLRPLLDALGAEGESQTKRRIEEEKTAPDGTPWESVSDDWGKRKRDGVSIGGVRVASTGGVLEFQGDLKDSIQYEVSGNDTVEWGSNQVYAAIHQLGGEAVGINIPERPYLGLSDENVDDMDAILTDWAEDLLR